MSVEVVVTRHFQKEAKKLIKKHPSLKHELVQLSKDLREKPEMGAPLGNACYKIRVAIKSKNRGKSGGARVVSHLVSQMRQCDNGDVIVYLLSIYDKAEFDTVADSDLKKLISAIKG